MFVTVFLAIWFILALFCLVKVLRRGELINQLIDYRAQTKRSRWPRKLQSMFEGYCITQLVAVLGRGQTTVSFPSHIELSLVPSVKTRQKEFLDRLERNRTALLLNMKYGRYLLNAFGTHRREADRYNKQVLMLFKKLRALANSVDAVYENQSFFGVYGILNDLERIRSEVNIEVRRDEFAKKEAEVELLCIRYEVEAEGRF